MATEKKIVELKELSGKIVQIGIDNLVPQTKSGYIGIDRRADTVEQVEKQTINQVANDRTMQQNFEIVLHQSTRQQIDWQNSVLALKVKFCKRTSTDVNSTDDGGAVVITATDNVSFTYPTSLFQEMRLTVDGKTLDRVVSPSHVLHDKIVTGEIPYEWVKSFGVTSGLMPDTSEHTLKHLHAGDFKYEADSKTDTSVAWRTLLVNASNAAIPAPAAPANTDLTITPSGTKWGITNEGRARAHDLIVNGEVAGNWTVVPFAIPLRYIFDIFNVHRFVPHFEEVKIEFTYANNRTEFLKVPADNKVDANSLGATCQLSYAAVWATQYHLSPQDEILISKLKQSDAIYPFRTWNVSSVQFQNGTSQFLYTQDHIGLIRSTYYITPAVDSTSYRSQFICTGAAAATDYVRTKKVSLDERQIATKSVDNPRYTHWYNYRELLRSVPAYQGSLQAIFMDEYKYRTLSYNIVNTHIMPSIMTEEGSRLRCDTRKRQLTEELNFAGNLSAQHYGKHILVSENYVYSAFDKASGKVGSSLLL